MPRGDSRLTTTAQVLHGISSACGELRSSNNRGSDDALKTLPISRLFASNDDGKAALSAHKFLVERTAASAATQPDRGLSRRLICIVGDECMNPTVTSRCNCRQISAGTYRHPVMSNEPAVLGSVRKPKLLVFAALPKSLVIYSL